MRIRRRIALLLILISSTLIGCQTTPSSLGYVIPQTESAHIKKQTLNSTFLSKDGSKPSVSIRSYEARVNADLNEDGFKDWFVAYNQYQKDKKGKFSIFWGDKKGRFVEEIITPDGCIHPRKPIINDFNNDSKLDVFVACHGWDQDYYPSEEPKLVLSQPNGGYKAQKAFDTKGYYHGGASADFNGDGNADVILGNSGGDYPIQLYLGDGEGRFERVSDFRLAGVNTKNPWYGAIELFDANFDGKFDLFIAGNEWSGRHFAGALTKIYYNTLDLGFSPDSPVVIPPVKFKGVVLDADVVNLNGTPNLYVLRTGDKSKEFYSGIYIQGVNLETLESNTVADVPNKSWIPWIKAWQEQGKNYVGSDDLTDSRLKPILLD